MTPWSWWWLEGDDDPHGGWQGDCASKEEAVADATRALPPGTVFKVVEARSSTAREHEESECVPFLRTRNEESLSTELRAA